MAKYLSLLILVLLLQCTPAFAQDDGRDYFSDLGTSVYYKIKNAPFPHQKRSKGYLYSGTNYTAEEHYSDNSTMVFIPKEYVKRDEVDIYIHFHGWYNNIDSTLHQFGLIEQLCESKKNAIFILPEGPKNAPDSFYGKLEEANGFRQFINEVLQKLYDDDLISSTKPGKIIISGHSGANRVLSYILLRGGLLPNIKEVYLFDGTYGHTEKFTHWIESSKGRFISIFADSTGTRGESERILEDFIYWGIPFKFVDNRNLTESDLTESKVTIVATNYRHEQVIHFHKNLLLCLRTSCLKDY